MFLCPWARHPRVSNLVLSKVFALELVGVSTRSRILAVT